MPSTLVQMAPGQAFSSFHQLVRLEAIAQEGQEGGLIEEESWDPQTERIITRTSQDIDPFIKYCKDRQIHEGKSAGRSPTGEFMHAATIPNWLYLEWKNKHGVDILKKDSTAAMKRLLNDPEYAWLRIWKGRL